MPVARAEGGEVPSQAVGTQAAKDVRVAGDVVFVVEIDETVVQRRLKGDGDQRDNNQLNNEN
jgi:hypothetical protein